MTEPVQIQEGKDPRKVFETAYPASESLSE